MEEQMRGKTTVVIACCAVALAAGAATLRAAAADPEAERAVMRGECQWAHASQVADVATLRMLEADDVTNVYPDGSTGGKDADIGEVEQGKVKFTAIHVGDLRVRQYGQAAVATGRTHLMGSYQGQDITGTYIFTDTWVNRDGRWQVVASQATRIMDANAPAVTDQCPSVMM
jgi:ketosteroid isomerase-like protein